MENNEEENIIVFDENEDVYVGEISLEEENNIVGGASYGVGSLCYSKTITTNPPKNKFRPTLVVSINGGSKSNVRVGVWVDGWYFSYNGACTKVVVKKLVGRVNRNETVKLYWGLADGKTQYIATVKI